MTSQKKPESDSRWHDMDDREVFGEEATRRPSRRGFVPETDVIWVALRYNTDAASGRLVGWQPGGSRHRRPGTGADSSWPAFALIMIHRRSSEWVPAPLLQVDAGWPMRFCASQEQAWDEARELAEIFCRRQATDNEKLYQEFWTQERARALGQGR